MRIFNKKPLALGVATGMAMLVASTSAMAISSGTDFNLSAKAAAGGMGGAAYTMPQEPSAAVFGNPATMTQFKGFNMDFAASFLDINLSSEDAAGKHRSDADSYILPNFGFTLQIAPGLVIGSGLEVDAGLGANYKDDPILGLLNLTVEIISFNANFAAAYEVTDQWSVGAAATVGFGLLQVGDSGGAYGAPGAFATLLTSSPGTPNAGGSVSSEHDIGFGLSLGTTYELQEGVMVSATIKSPVQYSFNRVASGGPVAGDVTATSLTTHFQDTDLEQPMEVILGVALDNVIMPGLLVEADVVWKQWGSADFYEDLWDDQFLITLGAQYETGDWTYRAGYSWAEDLIKSNPSGNHVGNLTHASPGVPFVPDAVRVVQMSLAPVIWQHTVTAGIGYNLTENVRLDAYAAYAFGETDSQDFKGVLSGDVPGMPVDYGSQKAHAESEIMFGAGINVALP